MPMYYFNLRENGHLIRDWAGCELYNDHEAIAAAQAHLRRAHACFSPGTGTSHVLEIWNRAGQLIATLPCSEETEVTPSVDRKPLGKGRARKTEKARRP